MSKAAQLDKYCSECGYKFVVPAHYCPQCGHPTTHTFLQQAAETNQISIAKTPATQTQQGVCDVCDGTTDTVDSRAPVYTQQDIQQAYTHKMPVPPYSADQTVSQTAAESTDTKVDLSKALAVCDVLPCPQNQVEKSHEPQKLNKHTAAALAFIFGAFGIHKFYLRKNTAAIFTLLVTLFGLISGYYKIAVIMAVIGVIECVMYTRLTNEQFEQRYISGQRNWF